MPKTTTPIDTPSGETLEYPAKLVTVAQYETNNPGLKNRMRGYILRADLHSPDFEGLREAIVRIGRSVYLDEPRADSWVNTRRTAPAALPRNPHGRAGKKGSAPLEALGPKKAKRPAATGRVRRSTLYLQRPRAYASPRTPATLAARQ